MKNNKFGFSLVIAMGLSLIIVLIALVLINFIIPFSREIKGVEHSSAAYYQVNSGFEDSMWFVTQNPLGSSTGKTYSSTKDFIYNIISTGSLIPSLGKGNSDFDKNWNKISTGKPIQMEVGNGRISDFSTNPPKAYFRVPNLSNSAGLTLSGGAVLPIISWQISSSSEALNASGTYLYANQVCTSDFSDTNCTTSTNNIIFNGSLNGETINGDSLSFSNFYNNNCVSSGCTLKLSVVNPIVLNSNNTLLPFLEWKINFGSDLNSVPDRYINISISGKSSLFQKSMDVFVPQKTLLDSFDFAVFQ